MSVDPSQQKNIAIFDAAGSVTNRFPLVTTVVIIKMGAHLGKPCGSKTGERKPPFNCFF